jgi:hypothetical protein
MDEFLFWGTLLVLVGFALINTIGKVFLILGIVCLIAGLGLLSVGIVKVIKYAIKKYGKKK